jgi:uncharacterized protein YndB with AHSA1/START domain
MERRNKDTAPSTKDRELIITRTFDHPRELVFEAWTNPTHVIQWWGPTGFTTTNHEMNVTPGGVWRFIMHGPDGTDYPNKIVFTEVVKPTKLVYVHGNDVANDPNEFLVTVTFEAEGKKTRLTLHMVVKSAEALAEMKKFGAVEGGHQTLSRLAEYLTTM